MIAEEFGLVGALTTLALLFLVVAFLPPGGVPQPHQFGRLLAIRLGTNYFPQCLRECGDGDQAPIPVGGVPLPLISQADRRCDGDAGLRACCCPAYVHRDADGAHARMTGRGVG